MPSYYERKQKEAFDAYQVALDSGDTKAAHTHMQDYTNYSEMLKNQQNNEKK